MNDVTDEQRAAVQRVINWTKPTLTAAEANDLTTVLGILPDALTNPQPALPTEQGFYVSVPEPDVVLNLQENGAWWYGADEWPITDVTDYAPFTRLVPERPEPTSNEIREAWGLSREDRSIPREIDGRMLAFHAYFAGYKAGAKR